MLKAGTSDAKLLQKSGSQSYSNQVSTSLKAYWKDTQYYARDHFKFGIDKVVVLNCICLHGTVHL